MRTNLFKSLLVAAMAIGAMGGVNSVKAETVTTLSFDDANNPTLTLDGQNGNRGSANYDYKFNESTFLNVWGVNNSNGSKIASINTENLIADDIQWTLEFDWAGYSGCNKQTGYTQIRDLKGNSFLSFDDAAAWGNTFSISSGGTLSCYPCNHSNRGSAATGSALTAEYWHHIKIVGNITGVKLYVQKYEKNGTLNESYIIDGALVNNENITPGSIALRPGSMGSVAIDNLVLSKETVKFKTADYTIFYKSGDNEIKTKETRTSIVNTNPTISDLDKSSFYNEDGTKKYIYVSDDAASKTIAEDGSTVVTIQFREAAKYNYTVNSNIEGYSVNGTVFENENAKVAFPQYILKDGVLYETNKIDNRKEFNWTFAVNEDKTVKTLNYKETTINNVAYYSEGENIDGLTIINSGNSAIRSSNSASAYAKDADVVFTTLPAGKYKLTSVVYKGSSSDATFSYKAGEKVIFTHKAETINSDTKTSEEFTLNESTPISLVKGGNDKQGIDFIYIQRTGDATETVSVSAAGFATYATNYNVKVPSDVEVMTVKVNKDNSTITLNKVEAGTVIPAKTGILVNAAAGNHDFVVTSDKSEESEALTKNDLKAATTDVTYDGTKYFFALTTLSDGKVGFAKVAKDVVIPAGKAYLEVPAASTAKFFGLDGEATGINSVKTAKADGAYYTLEGVKTTKPVKGLYIHNGKKIVVK